MSEINSETPVEYRSNVTDPDVLAAPTTTAPSAVDGGSLPDATYHSRVVGVNDYGRTTPSQDRTQATSGTDNTVRVPISQLANATHYDVYVSTDADPKWVGRVSEAQRAAGCVITAVGMVAAGGAPGAVDVEIPGTGAQAGTSAAVNTAYSVPDAIGGGGNRYISFDIRASRTGDVQSLACVVVPFFYNSRTDSYYAGAPIPLIFGGGAGVYTPAQQRISIETRGVPIALVVQSLAGTGARVDIDYVLS